MNPPDAHETPFVIREPVDLIALAPVVLGFWPTESVVMETFGGPGGSFHARGDLQHSRTDQEALADHLVGAAVRNGAVDAAVVVFGDDLRLARRQGRAMRDRLRAAGVGVIDVLCADGSRYHGLNGGKGTPYDLQAHPFIVQRVFDGALVHESREDVAASLTGAEPADRLAVAEAAAAVDPVALRPEAKHAEALWLQGRIRRFRRTGEVPTAAEAGRMLALCVDPDLRDVAWAEMAREHGDAHVVLWRDLLRRAPEALTGHAAGLLAFAAWLSGDGALAWCAIEAVPPGQEAGELVDIVSDALMTARPPTSWRRFCAGLFTDRHRIRTG